MPALLSCAYAVEQSNDIQLQCYKLFKKWHDFLKKAIALWLYD
jgi:hypothetical protein